MKKFLLPTFFLIVIISVAIVTFYWSFGYTSPFENDFTEAVKGVYNLKEFDFTNQKNVKLVGESEMYWEQLLVPEDFKKNKQLKPDTYLHIPGLWNGLEINGKKLSSDGYATFRLLILVDSVLEYGIKIKEFDCSYKLWIDGVLLAEVGKVGTTDSTTQPSWKRKEVYFKNTSDTIELIFQVANFIHRKGGPEDVMYFGLASKIKAYKNMQTSISLFLIGVLFIMAFYHTVLYIYRPRDNSVLYFSLFSFLVLFRLVTTGEKLLIDFLPDLTFITAVRIEYISYTLAVPICFSFFNFFTHNKTPGWLINLVYTISILTVIVILFFPIKVFSYTPLFYQFMVLILAIFIFIQLIIDLYNKVPHTYILFGGYFFFAILILNDILYYNQLINSSQLLPLGLFILVFSQAFVLSRTSSSTFTQVEKLSAELDFKNKELEIKVIDRTREILKKKEEIEYQKTVLEKQAEILSNANQQLIELNSFKEGITGMLVHDLKNPLNVILNLSTNQMVKYAGNQMLNLIHNLQDIQKYEHTAMQLDKQVQAINVIINSAIEQVDYLRLKKNIEFINDIDDIISFEFDANIIERVFINLFTNAIKYSPEDSQINLKYSIGNNIITFSICDQGIGIPDEKRHVIFSKYGQIVARKSGHANSLGLGLAFCKLAVESHSGQIGFDDNKPKGSVFWFTLPFFNSKITHNHLPNLNHSDEQLHFIELVLSQDDKNYLKTFLPAILRYQIYEITDINKELRKIDNNYSKTVYLWKKALHDAANAINQSRYASLIQMVQ